MNVIKKETGHWNISDTALRRIKKYYGKKIKYITEKEKKYKAFYKDKEGIFIIEKLTRDIINRSFYYWSWWKKSWKLWLR